MRAKDEDVICDRCKRDPGATEDGVAYCYHCSHECTFTMAELREPDVSDFMPTRDALWRGLR
jgi:hypothetical protein